MNAIIFGNDGVNSLGLIRSLGKKGHNVFLLVHENIVNYTSKSKYVKGIRIVRSGDDWLKSIQDLCTEIEGPIFLFATGDKEAKFINLHHSELQDYCYAEGGYNPQTKNKYFDKDYIYSLAQKEGLTLIKTYIIEDSSIPLPDMEYPVIVKAHDSTLGGKSVMRVCADKEILQNHLDSISKSYFPLQIQPFLKKNYEIMIQGCSAKQGDNVIAPVCFIKTRFSGCGKGYGAYGYSAYIDDDKRLTELRRKIASILNKIQYQGLFSAEFLYARGEAYFLEINFRNDGTAIVSTYSGVNLPDILCKSVCITNNNLLSDSTFHKVFYMCDGDIWNVVHGEISIYRWLKDAFRKDCHWYMIDKNDMMPVFYYIYYRIRRKIKNLLLK